MLEGKRRREDTHDGRHVIRWSSLNYRRKVFDSSLATKIPPQVFQLFYSHAQLVRVTMMYVMVLRRAGASCAPSVCGVYSRYISGRTYRVLTLPFHRAARHVPRVRCSKSGLSRRPPRRGSPPTGYRTLLGSCLPSAAIESAADGRRELLQEIRACFFRTRHADVFASPGRRLGPGGRGSPRRARRSRLTVAYLSSVRRADPTRDRTE